MSRSLLILAAAAGCLLPTGGGDCEQPPSPVESCPASTGGGSTGPAGSTSTGSTGGSTGAASTGSTGAPAASTGAAEGGSSGTTLDSSSGDGDTCCEDMPPPPPDPRACLADLEPGDTCGTCACKGCLVQLDKCRQIPGCADIFECMRASACLDFGTCADVCDAVIWPNGGTAGLPYFLARDLQTCELAECGALCI